MACASPGTLLCVSTPNPLFLFSLLIYWHQTSTTEGVYNVQQPFDNPKQGLFILYTNTIAGLFSLPCKKQRYQGLTPCIHVPSPSGTSPAGIYTFKMRQPEQGKEKKEKQGRGGLKKVDWVTLAPLSVISVRFAKPPHVQDYVNNY